MEVSIAKPAVLGRIGLTLDELTDDVLTEPLPKCMKALLAPDDPTDILWVCGLVDALTNKHRIVERNGELFIN